jgi:hypothetical protein
MVMTTNPMTRNHPRVRGEESQQAAGGFSESESPPRARGRVFRMVLLFTAIGITPACAGKRITAWLLQSLPAESPPRARGREHFLPVRRIKVGNHPRVRGEESNENAAFEGMGIPPKCKFFVLFRNVLRVPCDSRARGSKAIRLSSIRACYMLCVPNTRAGHRVFHGGALFVSDIPVITKWN